MNQKGHKIGALLLPLLVITACGQGTDPLTTLGNPSSFLVGTMSLPITSQFSSLQAPFSSTFNGFALAGNWTTLTVPPIKAPANGVVTAVDLGGQSVTIMHNSHVTTQITYVNSSVQAGTYVNQDTQIGVATSTNNYVKFSVFVDGTAVCPLSFLSSSARAQMYNQITTTPCQ